MIFKNAKILNLDNNQFDIADIKVENQKIVNIGKNLTASETIELDNRIVVPAFIEIHSHLREPGFEYKETIDTATGSAINGGYCAVVAMANTNPICDNLKSLNYLLNKTAKIKILPICAVTKNFEDKILTDMVAMKKAGAIAFSNDGKPVENMKLLLDAMQIAKDNDLLIISHAEDSTIKDIFDVSENIAVARELELVRKINCKYHFAHISTKRSVELIRQAKKDGLKVTCETAPHYFSLTQNDILNNDARFKMNPPLRLQEDVDAMIEGLKDGTIDCIATDHAPHSMEEKQKSWNDSPMGIVGFETAFALANTYLVEKGHLSLAEIVKKMTSNPSKILGINDYSSIKIGNYANFCVIDENKKWIVKGENFKSKCKITPFEDKELIGKVVQTVIKGRDYKNV